jgi:hypothetical protein
MVLATKLDWLDHSVKGNLDALERFTSRNVRVIVIQFLGGQTIDMDSTVGRLVVNPVHRTGATAIG